MEKYISKDDVIKLKKQLETLKLADPKKINSCGIIDIDNALFASLKFYKTAVEKIRNPMEEVLNGIDLDGNKMINLYEFALLSIFFGNGMLDMDKIKEIFYANANQSEKQDGIAMMQFSQLVEVCQHERLLAEDSQNRFLLNLNADAYITFLQLLTQKFDDIVNDIKQRFYVSEFDNYINVVLGKYKQRIISNSLKSERSIILIRHLDNL
jgi:hypothetical protein